MSIFFFFWRISILGSKWDLAFLLIETDTRDLLAVLYDFGFVIVSKWLVEMFRPFCLFVCYIL